MTGQLLGTEVYWSWSESEDIEWSEDDDNRGLSCELGLESGQIEHKFKWMSNISCSWDFEAIWNRSLFRSFDWSSRWWDWEINSWLSFSFRIGRHEVRSWLDLNLSGHL